MMSAAVAAVVVGMFVGRADAGSGQTCSAGACDSAAPASVVAAEKPGDALTLDPVHIMDVETAADTDTGWYGAVIGGYSFPDDLEVEGFDVAMDEGFAVLGALGTNLGVIRVEAEGGYRMNDVDEPGTEGEVTAISVMGNVLYDHPIADAIDLYVGGGVGVAFVELENGESDDDTVLAYQFLAGLAFYTSDNFAITAGYRLWTTSDLEIEGADIGMPLYHQAEVGVRFEF
jgi:opacity protein-like surface antigen